jgi:hypothetical protein
MNHAQTAATLIEYADRCIAAYDAADPSDRSAAMKTALSECFHEYSRLKSNLQLGSREKVIFSLDNNPKRKSVLKHVRTARPDIPVDTFIMKFAMPEIISEKTKEDNTRAAAVLQQGKFAVNTKAFHEKMKEIACKLVAKEIVNLKLAKLVLNYTAALRINESSAGTREHVPVRSDYCVDNHVLTFAGGSKVQEGETTRPAYAKLSLFNDTTTNGLLDIIFEAPSPLDSIDKTMTTSDFDMLMQQFCISSFITPLAVPRFLPSHMRSLGARMIEVLFDNDVLVNSAGSILHITRRCLGHKSCETTQRYVSIKCNGDMPTKIGCVSHVDQADLIDGSFVVKLYEESSTKRRRNRRRGGRKHKRQCV